MSIATQHPEYTNNLKFWARCRVTFEGEDAVKDAGQDYLPPLGPVTTVEDREAYEHYKTRATFTNMVAPTVEGITGLILRVEPTFKVPPQMEDLLDDITGDGVSAREWINGMITELLITGRCPQWADWSETKKRPIVVPYTAESLINWRTDELYVLKECYYAQDEKDPYASVEATQYRELLLVEGTYTVNIWRERKNANGQNEWFIFETKVPAIAEKALGELPLFVCSITGSESVQRPPLLDLVNVNLSHYRTSADLEHGLHFTALPTPWASGVNLPTDADGNQLTLRIGSGTAWLLPSGGQAGYLEFSGAGLAALKQAKDDKAKEAAALGALMLVELQKQAETAETARIHSAGKTSRLHRVVEAVEKTAERVLEFMATTMRLPTTIEVEINTEFIETVLSAQEITALTDAWSKGAFSYETLFDNLQKGKVIKADRTLQEEKDALLNEHGPTGELPTTGQPGGQGDAQGGPGATGPAQGGPAGKGDPNASQIEE